MPALIDMIEGSRVEYHQPWPRVVTDENGWRFAAGQLSAGHWTLLGLWGDTGQGTSQVHMAVLDEGTSEIAVVSIACPDGSYPSVGAVHPPAIRLERAIRDLFGFVPVGEFKDWSDSDTDDAPAVAARGRADCGG